MAGSAGRPDQGESWHSLAGKTLVAEEKADGEEITIWFESGDPMPRMAARTTPLTPGIGLIGAWGAFIAPALRARIGEDFAVTGMWMERTHAVFYDCLPHLFWECDVRELSSGHYLDTPSRRELLGDVLIPVPVLHHGPHGRPEDLRDLAGRSAAISSDWRDAFAQASTEARVPVARAESWITADQMMEGLYIKHEAAGRVAGRYKFIRPAFLARIHAQDGHWSSRPRIQNRTRSAEVLWT